MKSLLLILIVFSLVSCNNFSKYKKHTIRHNRILLENSFKTGDRLTAISSIQNILAYDTSNYGLLDTLANLYIQLDDLGSAYQTSNKMKALKPDDMHALEIYGTMASRLNKSAEALDAFTKLYEKKKNTAYLYEIGVQNMNLGKVDAGRTVIESLLNMPQSVTDIYIARLGTNQYQQVPVIAMAYYFLGSYEEILGRTAKAIEYYQNSLKYYSDFSLPKSKLLKTGK